MIRRMPVLALVAALVAAPLVLPAAAGPPPGYPLDGCFTIHDAVGDAGDDDLDIRGVALKTTGSSLQAYIRVNSLQAAPRGADGHRFTLAFTFNRHRFEASGSAFAHGGAAVRESAGRTGLTGRTTQLTVDRGAVYAGNRSSGLSATFDTARSFVVLDLPAADIVRYGQAPFNSVLSQVEVTSAYDAFAVSQTADSTVPRGSRSSSSTYAVGDNHCFGPAPAVITLLSTTVAQYGDAVQVTARLQDASGRPLAQRPVTFSLGTSRSTGSTTSEGLAKVVLDPALQAGAYPLTISFAGDAVAGAVTSVRSFSVVAERTVMTVKSQKRRSDRYVQATLRDDDGRAVAGVTITWTVGGASAGSAVTSSKGTAELHDLSNGVAVQASFGGVSGMYLGSTGSARTTPHDD